MKSQLMINISATIVLLGSNLAFEIMPAQASNNGNRARESEGKQYVGATVRSQQAFYLENSKFAASFEELGRQFPAQTSSYSYSIKKLNKSLVQVNAVSKIAGVRNYTGFVFLLQGSSNSEMTTIAGVCQSNQSNSGKTPPKFSVIKNNVQCPTGYTALGKK
jgi:type IV pilus assembly protein PilA